VALVGLIGLTFVAALADTFGWKGWWVTATFVLVAVLGLVWKLWHDVVEPARERAQAETTERVHATAIEIMLTSSEGGSVSVSVLNRGTHHIKSVEVLAMPVGAELDEMLAGPTFRPPLGAQNPEVQHTAMPGGDLYCRIAELIPDRGYGIGTYLETPGAETRVTFEVRWIDHGGQLRKAVGTADLADVARERLHTVTMNPRQG
jgi:hypothetical protein